MSRTPPPPSDHDREQLQAELTRLIGSGHLDVDAFDGFAARVWAAETTAELDQIRAEARGDAPGASIPMAQPQGTVAPSHPSGSLDQPIVNHLGEITRSGEWTIPADSYYKLNGSTLWLDLRSAHASAPVVYFHVTATMSEIRIMVPPGVHVDNQARMKMASSESLDVTQPAAGSPRVIVDGLLRMSSLEVVTKEPSSGSSFWKKLFGE